jgi:DNA-binding MarR family transcriptional regulator
MTEVAERARERTRAEHPDREQIAAVADNLTALLRTFGRARARLLAAAQHDVEWSAHIILKCLHSEGEMRASALAECLHSDPSTVSRQVAALVKEGLLERRSDPEDGRASLLALTPAADAVLADHDEIRLEHFARVLDGWSETDLRRFAALLRRFTAAYETADTEWVGDRMANRAARRGRNG